MSAQTERTRFTMHHCERDSARSALAGELASRGWKVGGIKPDNSDLMTDYWDPSDWHGFALHPETRAVAWCVGYAWDGWISREDDDPELRQIAVETAQMIKRIESELSPHKRSRCNWVVAINGRLIATGIGLYTFDTQENRTDPRDQTDPYRGKYRGPARVVADKIDRALRDHSNGNRSRTSSHPSSDQLGEQTGAGLLDEGIAYTLNRSLIRDTHTEIRFDAKPTEDCRSALKSSGFRWSRRNLCWYGPTAQLPSYLMEHAPDRLLPIATPEGAD